MKLCHFSETRLKELHGFADIFNLLFVAGASVLLETPVLPTNSSPQQGPKSFDSYLDRRRRNGHWTSEAVVQVRLAFQAIYRVFDLKSKSNHDQLIMFRPH